ncbi:MAG: tetratricopeptide repeat protein [Deltaproteobacteria bacterium]|nr:tetratricopeptide repeat protein [Deltaproteobacteria bacterium]
MASQFIPLDGHADDAVGWKAQARDHAQPMKRCSISQDHHWSEAMVEACWLMAAALIPLFFNPYSQRVFEPDKMALLRSLATLTLAGWGVRLWVRWRTSAPTSAHFPGHEPKPRQGWWCGVSVILAALLFLVVSILSAGISIMPRISWLGSYERMGGVMTTASCGVFFFSLIWGLRRQDQLDRLVSAIVLASLPIALYGVLQHFHLDPLSFHHMVVRRCTSTAGNPSFLGGYLVMVIPLTLVRLLSGWHRVTGDPEGSDWVWGALAVGCSTTALVTGVLVLVWDMSPIRAWIVIAALLAVQVPLYARIPSARLGTVLYTALPLICCGFMLSLCLMDVFLAAGGSWYFWALAGAMAIFFLVMTVLARPLGRNPLHALIATAYAGALTIQLACLLFTQSRGSIMALSAAMGLFFMVWGMIKNRGWISWAAIGGLVGGLGLMWLWAGNESALMQSRPGLEKFSALTSGPTIRVRRLIWQGAGELWMSDSPFTYVDADGETRSGGWDGLRPALGYGPETFRYVFPRVHQPEVLVIEPHGVPDRAHNLILHQLITRGWLGACAFLFFFTVVLFCGLRGLSPGRPFGGPVFLALWVWGGLAGGLAAWVSRDSLFWGLGIPVGLLLGLAVYMLIRLLGQSLAPSKPPSPPLGSRLILLALLTALTGHFMEVQFGFSVASTALYFWMFSALTAVVALGFRQQAAQPEPAIAAFSDSRAGPRKLKKRSGPDDDSPFGPGQVYPLGVLLLMILATLLFEMVPLPYPHILTGYWGLLLGSGLLLTWVLHSRRETERLGTHGPRPKIRRGPEWVPVLVCTLALLVVCAVHLRPLYADLDLRRALDLQKRGRGEASISFLKAAHALCPQESAYVSALGQAYLRLGATPHSTGQDAWLAKAETAFGRVLKENPMDPQHHVNMGALYTAWAGRSQGSEREERFQKAWECYERAWSMKPGDHEILFSWSQSLRAGGRPRQARALLRRILRLAPFPPVFLRLGETYLQQGEWAPAREVYERAIAQDPDSVEAHSGLGYALAKMDRLEEAALAYQEAILLSPKRYNDYKNLGLVYQGLGRTCQAAQRLRQALSLAPEQNKPPIREALEALSQTDPP